MTTKTLELEELRIEADRLGVKYHHKANAETLKNSINEFYADQYKKQLEAAKQESTAIQQTEEISSEASLHPGQAEDPFKRKVKVRGSQFSREPFAKRKKDAKRLVRCRIQCMNPIKKEWTGEYVMSGSAKLGPIKKFLQYGVEWHMPKILIDVLDEKTCTMFKSEKNKLGHDIRVPYQAKEYAIEILPNLTEKELKDLATEQSVAQRI